MILDLVKRNKSKQKYKRSCAKPNLAYNNCFTFSKCNNIKEFVKLSFDSKLNDLKEF